MANRLARKPQSTEVASEIHSIKCSPSKPVVEIPYLDIFWTEYVNWGTYPTKNEAYGEWGNFAVPWASEALPFMVPCGIPALRFLPASL